MPDSQKSTIDFASCEKQYPKGQQCNDATQSQPLKHADNSPKNEEQTDSKAHNKGVQ
jgi:hypothetical protein